MNQAVYLRLYICDDEVSAKRKNLQPELQVVGSNFPTLVAGQDSNLRPLGYELAGRGLSRYARSHSCRPATFSRPTCLAPSRLFASVPPCSVAKSVAHPPLAAAAPTASGDRIQ